MLSGPIENDRDTEEDDGSTENIVKIGLSAIKDPSPEHRHYNEKTAIGCIDSMKMGWLKCRDDSIHKQGKSSKYPYNPALTLSQPLPDLICE